MAIQSVDGNEMSVARKSSHWARRIVDVLSCLVMLLELALSASDLWGFFMHPQSYPIGAEMAGFRYSTRAAFLGLTSGIAVLSLAGLSVPLLLKPAGVRTLVRASVATLLLAIAAYLALGVDW